MVPNEANQKILEAIAATEGPITLGLLPLSAEEEEMCIDQVTECCNGSVTTLIHLLRVLTPAAAAYAIAAGASQAVREGGRFWQPVSDRLGIPLDDPNIRERLSLQYQKACLMLGIVNPDVSQMTWRHIAPMMAQASILRRWVESLANGLQSTIRHRPLPDLDDYRALEGFAKDLAARVHGQPNLRSVLETEVGPVVAHRLIASCVYDQFSILPAHLVDPIQTALRDSGRQVSLKSPYASFSIVNGCFELVLPKQPASLTTHQTHWVVNGVQHSPSNEHRISEYEAGSGGLTIDLRDLGKGYSDQEFEVYLGLNDAFRVFDHDSLRERSVKVGGETELTPSDYLIVMRSACESNDREAEEVRGDYRILQQVSMRPGWEPIEIEHKGETSILLPALKAGIFQSSEDGVSTLLEDGKRLHYGDVFGFQAYIPKSQHSGSLSVGVFSRDSVLCEEDVLLQEEEKGVYDYSKDLEGLLFQAVKDLSAGVHPIKIEISARAASVTREFWYWRGLNRISLHLGFLCGEAPGNIDYNGSKGLKPSDRGCEVPKSFHAPRIVIALKEGERLKIARPGVRAISTDQADGWRSDLSGSDTLSVAETDRRVITFQSGGFEKWSLTCNGTEFSSLDERRTEVHLGLRFFIAEFGQSGTIEACNTSGDCFRLFRYASDLVARRLKHEIDHGRNLHHWITSIPTEKLGRLGVSVSDYSESPEPVVEGPVEVFRKQEVGEEWEVSLMDGLRLSAIHQPAENHVPSRVRLSLEVDPAKVGKQLLLIEWFQGAESSNFWEALFCDDGPSTSRLAVVFQGSDPFEEGFPSWWTHLWRVNRVNVADEDLGLYGGADLGGIDRSLQAISCLTSIKFPAAVYEYSARFFSTIGHKLSERRLANGQNDTNSWWSSGAEELQQHSLEKLTPVVRQFLISSNVSMLAQQWSGEVHGDSGACGMIVDSFNLIHEVAEAGGRVPYTQAVYHDSKHPEELFTSFKNFNQVLTGQSSTFSGFDFQVFFKKVLDRVVAHSESGVFLDSYSLLSARHLLHAISSLNRRVRILAQAGDQEAGHGLSVALSTLSGIHRQSEGLVPIWNTQIGYSPAPRVLDLDRMDHFDTQYFPDLPALGGTQAKHLADLAWTICLLSRATAHGINSRENFVEKMRLFTGKSVHSSSLNLVLSFAPELFAYYTALLDFALFNPTSPTQS
tara:strand:+ start:9582 stop:13142 length:3561 start_codon:yes stop_codon:yes gene_type:complete